MEKKSPRRTKARILEVSLGLFNDFGEPNVTTNAIADEMGISPGNLYYHYRSKDEIVALLFAEFEREIDGLFGVNGTHGAEVEDIWFWLHLYFEKIWKYRFIYRDLTNLLSRHRVIETHFKIILQHSQQSTEQMLRGLRESGQLQASDGEIRAVATNAVLAATFWYSYAYVLDPRKLAADAAIAQGVFQVMVMIAPYMQGDGRALFERLAAAYR